MARKLTRDKEGKRTLMRENALHRGWCAACKRNGMSNQLYKYWYEPDIGGNDAPDRHEMPFCSIECWRTYNCEEAA